MKIFTKKIFMLSAALLLSVGSFAQDEGTPVTQHGYPEVKFTYTVNGSSNVYTIPAWDAWWMTDDHHYVDGHIRVQKKTKRDDGKFVGKIVTRYFLYDDTYQSNRLRVPASDATSFPVTNVTINGEVVAASADLMTLTYGIVPENLRVENYNYETVYVYDKSGIGVAQGNVKANGIDKDDDYTVPTTLTHSTTGDQYIINEVGDYAYRQHYSRRDNSNFFEPKSITIPKEITKIGRGAFFMTPSEKVVFEDGNTIGTILEFNFQDNQILKEITFPSSVQTLMGTVLGGCAQLRKICFTSETVPTFEPFTWHATASSTKTYDAFQTSTSVSATQLNKCVISVPLKTASINAYTAVDKFSNSLLASRVPLSASNMATCCVTKSFTTNQFDIQTEGWVDGDLKAYQVKQDGVKEDRVVLTSIDNEKIPAEVGVVLKGSAGKEYEIFYLDNNANIDNMFKLELDPFNPVDNILEGVTEKTYMDMETIGGEDRSFFILSSNGSFLLVTSSGWLAANRAYLFYEGEMNWNFNPNARGLSVTLPEETGIATLETKSVQNDTWYTLQGIQVNQPQKGIFIKNGKKFVIK